MPAATASRGLVDPTPKNPLTHDTSHIRLKIWWRFEEARLDVDQEFFSRIPSSRRNLLVATESGGFRRPGEWHDTSQPLFVQGTAFLGPTTLAVLIVDWITEKPSLITLADESGERLTFKAPMKIGPGLVAQEIIALAEGSDSPLRLHCFFAEDVLLHQAEDLEDAERILFAESAP